MREALQAQNMGRVVRAFRTHPFHGNSITQTIIADLLGVTQSTLSRLELGRLPFTPDMLKLCAIALRIPETYWWFAADMAAGRTAATCPSRRTEHRQATAALSEEATPRCAITSAAAGSQEIADLPNGARGACETAPDPAVILAALTAAEAIAAIDSRVGLIIDRYEREGPHLLVPELLSWRDLSVALGPKLAGDQRGRLTASLARQHALLAYMAVAQEKFAAAQGYALTAELLATAQADPDLLAWIKGTQSFCAYYQEDYAQALALAQSGAQLATTSAQRIRLWSNGVARAAGKLGGRYLTEQACGRALELVEHTPGPAGMTSCIDLEPYGRARTLANVATARLALGDRDHVLALTAELDRPVSESNSAWSRALIKLDQATALTCGPGADQDHAAALGMQALAIDGLVPIASVHRRARDLAAQFTRCGATRAAATFIDALTAWKSSA